MSQDIKAEFEKAFREEKFSMLENSFDAALWGARFMSEAIAQYHVDRYEYTGEATAFEIRRLAAQLESGE